MESEARPVELHRQLPHAAEAVWRAREMVSEAFGALITAASLGTVHLLLTELVTNAYKFGAPARLIDLDARIEGDRLDVCVSNASIGTSWPALVRPGMSAGGLGLQLINRLADEWGTRCGDRTDVWFRLTVDPR